LSLRGRWPATDPVDLLSGRALPSAWRSAAVGARRRPVAGSIAACTPGWTTVACLACDIFDAGGRAMAAPAASVATAATATAPISFFCITGFLPLKERTETIDFPQCPR